MATKSKIAADAVVLGADVIELAAETAGEVADIVESQAVEVVTIVKNNPIMLAGVALVGLSAGGFAGYKFAIKKLGTRYADALQEELESTRRFYKSGVFETPEEAVEELIEEEFETAPDPQLEEAVRAMRAYNRPAKTVEVETRNVFADKPADEFTTLESQTEPFFVSFVDFNNVEPGRDQLNLTYYVKDDTLADEADNVIEHVSATVGVGNLDLIRNGKPGLNTYYVRNPETEMDFEIARVNRGYSETMQLESDES